MNEEVKQKAQKELALRELEKRHKLQRNSLHEYLKYYWKEEKNEVLDDNWHIELICDRLEKVHRGEIKRLIINIPPRTLKTEIVSKAFPTWSMGQKPTKFIAVSYSAELAQKNSGGARDMYGSEAYSDMFPRRVKLKEDQNTKQHWETQDGSQYYATGATGTITGVGADIIIIDDPLKPGDAQSDLVRTNVNNNYHDTIVSRLNSKIDGAIIIIMQRLHDDDLVGHLKAKMEDGTGENWELLEIPALGVKDDDYRKEGESFFPKRFPDDILRALKKEDEIVFACQYQQDPTSEGSAEFHREWIRTYTEIPRGGRIFTTCDPAFTTNTYSDYSAITTVKFIGDELYILEQTVKKVTPPELEDILVYHIKKWNPEACGIEAFQAQVTIRHSLQARLKREGIAKVLLVDIKQPGEKVAKIRGLIPLYRNGQVYHCEGLDKLEEQLFKFPRGKHDDAPDSLQMALYLYELQPNTGKTYKMPKIVYDRYGQPQLVK